MNYEQALEAIKKDISFASADFYRMQTADTIALGLMDSPAKILMDVVTHGTPEARFALQSAMEQGIVVSNHIEANGGYDVLDIMVPGANQYARSHMAMQIAYPKLYHGFFGEKVWRGEHPKMLELVDLNVSCLTNKLHPSDYYGKHEIPGDVRKQGRPKVKPVKVTDGKFATWVEACQGYKKQVTEAWQIYLDACANKKLMEKSAKAWRDTELNKLRDQMSSISKQYDEGMSTYNKAIDEAKSQHAQLKEKGKPKREEYE